MPIPILFIGIAVATGAVGIGKTTKAGFDQYNAKKLNENSDERMKEAANRLNVYRQQCEKSLEMLGEEKLFVLNGNISDFMDTFTQIKNVDFKESLGLRKSKDLRRLVLSDRNRLDTGTEYFSEIRRVINGETDEGGIDTPAGGELDAKHIIRHEKDHNQLQHKGGSAENGNADLHENIQRLEFAHPREREKNAEGHRKQ